MANSKTQRARQLRKAQNIYEGLLWKLLRDRRLEGYKFRRQYPIGPYFADFACLETKLIVELDGNSHDARQAADAMRDEYLKQQGWQTLRVRNVELMRDGNGVVLPILHHLAAPIQK